jgi:hypothetical protein
MPRFAASLSTLYGEHDFLDRFRRGGGRQLPSLQGANRMTDQLAAAFDSRTPHVGAAAAESSPTTFAGERLSCFGT